MEGGRGGVATVRVYMRVCGPLAVGVPMQKQSQFAVNRLVACILHTPSLRLSASVQSAVECGIVDAHAACTSTRKVEVSSELTTSERQ